MIILQLLIYCLLFTAMVKIAVIGGAVNGLYFYPKTVQDQAIELGLIDRNTMNRKRKCFMIPFFIVMLAALVLSRTEKDYPALLHRAGLDRTIL